MSEKKKVYGEGILKNSVRETAVYVDKKGNTWICDKDAIGDIDPNKPLEKQNIERCQIMPFDHGG
jgi:streptogramin lyase